jgi:hypothetical protein
MLPAKRCAEADENETVPVSHAGFLRLSLWHCCLLLTYIAAKHNKKYLALLATPKSIEIIHSRVCTHHRLAQKDSWLTLGY